jgi:hypothetical protein
LTEDRLFSPQNRQAEAADGLTERAELIGVGVKGAAVEALPARFGPA